MIIEKFAKSHQLILCLHETKLDYSYPDSQFKIDGFQYLPLRIDQNRHGGSKMVFIKEGIFNKSLSNYETKTSETICIEVTISKENWCRISAYSPPQNSNKFKIPWINSRYKFKWINFQIWNIVFDDCLVFFYFLLFFFANVFLYSIN